MVAAAKPKRYLVVDTNQDRVDLCNSLEEARSSAENMAEDMEYTAGDAEDLIHVYEVSKELTVNAQTERVAVTLG